MLNISKTRLIKLQKQLKTDRVIAEKFGVSITTICGLRKKYGIASRYAKNPARNAKIVALYKKGTRLSVLMNKFNMIDTSIYTILKQAGVKSAKHWAKTGPRK